MSDKDYVVLTVVSPGHQGEKSEADFTKWFQGTDYKDLPVLLDPDGKLLEAYGVRSYPTEVFIGSDGVLAKKHIGYAKNQTSKRPLKVYIRKDQLIGIRKKELSLWNTNGNYGYLSLEWSC